MIYHGTYILNFMRCAILTLGGKAFSRRGGEVTLFTEYILLHLHVCFVYPFLAFITIYTVNWKPGTD